MTNQSQLKILISGEFDCGEFHQKFVLPQDSAHDIVFAEWTEISGDNSETQIDQPESFDLVVVAQARRGQFQQSDIDNVIQQFPLAGRVLLVGSWCEGETRSGHPLNGIHRVYLRNWEIEFAGLVQELTESGSTNLSRPATETIADRLMDSTDPSELLESSGPLNIAIHAVSPELLTTIQEFCQVRGWQARRLGETKKCDVAIVECYYSIDEAISLAESDPLLRRTPFVAICGFPRQQDRQRLSELPQRTHLLGKPFENEFLESAIKRLVSNGQLNVISNVA